jgi:protein-disulfide isomerase
VYTVLEDCLRRSPLTAFVLLAILFDCSTLLAACKNTSQPAEPSAAAAAQPQPAASVPAAPASSTPTNAEPQSAKEAAAKGAQAKSAPTAPAQSASTSSAISVAGLPDVDPRETRGSKTAPIVIETFSDFQCPACKQLYMTTNRQLNDNYITTGKVFEIHRDFPLAGHAYSRVAARYSRAAAALGKFEQVEQVLFQNQEKWEQTGDVDGTVASTFSPAEMTKIRAAIKNPAVEAAIEKDIALGKTYSVSQTPTTVIHYKGQTFPISGVVGYDALRTFLDQLLSSR